MEMDLNKLKVPELRKELQSRGLDSKGNKPVLVERLREAIEKENAGKEESENEEEVASSEENSLMYTTAESETAPPPLEPDKEENASSVITAAASTEQDISSIKAADEQPNISAENISGNVTAIEPSINDESVDGTESTQEMYDSDSLQQTYDLENTAIEQEAEPSTKLIPEMNQSVDQDQSTFDYGQSNDSNQSNDYSVSRETVPTDTALKIEEEIRNVNEETMDVAESGEILKQDNLSKDNQNTFSGTNFISHPEETKESEDNFTQESTTNEIVTEQKEHETEPNIQSEQAIVSTTEEQMEVQEDVEEPKKRTRKSRFDQPEERNDVFEQLEDGSGNRYDEDRKRRHSPSPSGNGATWGTYEAPPKVAKQDDEPSFDDEAVLLSWYDSDLNLIINKENFLNGVPLHDQDFMYMWAGARSTYGFQSGKVYFDVKLIEKNTINEVDEFEMYSFRLGWSVAYSSLQLGEVPLSYGYDSSGKKCTDNNFEDYGQSFNAEDVIGCLLDFDSNEENILISYTFNGVSQGVAFEIPKEQLEGKALFPHVLSKNISFEMNFGEREDGWNLEEKFENDFTWTSKVPLENRIKGPRKPEEKKECEIIMLCGLPCSGKTTWIKKHVQESPEKMYNVIGIDSVLNKMKVLNEPIETYYKEKDSLNVLIERCTKCMNRIFELACIRWRNYIVDQNNVALVAQRRRMRCFEGFKRVAVITLPKEEDYEKYLEKWDENVVRDTSISLLELKSNFRLPEEGELFDTVMFEGTTREEAEELIRKYNKEGRDARPPREDRGFNRGGFYRDDRYGRPMGGGYRSRWIDRGGPHSLGRGGWAPRGGMDRMSGGFRDRRNWRERDDDREGFRGGRYGPRDQGGRYGSGGGGMMGGNRWGGNRDRDRMGPGSRGGGPNPLMGSLVGKPGGGGPMGYGGGERKSRFEDKRDGDEFERSGRVGPPGVEEESEEQMDKGNTSLGGEDDRKRYSRFSDGPSGGFRGGRGGGGFRGRGGGGPDRGGDRGGRFGGHFRPNNGAGPRGGGFNRNREDGGGRFYGGRGGGPQGRDNRDNRNPMNNQQRPGGGMNNRFDKRDNSNSTGNKNDSNSGNQQQSNWNMYGQGGWNQYPWAQYQQAGYNPQQLQQYWSQMQQQQSQNSGSTQQSGQQTSKTGPGAMANSTNTPSTTAQPNAGSNTSSTQQSGSNAGYNTQGYNTQGYNAQGYDANAYAQYCAYYSQLAAQQGWPQNAWAQYAGYNYNATAAAGGATTGSGSTGANTGPSSASGPSNMNAAVTSK